MTILIGLSLADDFGVGAWGDDADEAVAVEVEIDFEVFGFHYKLIEFLATRVLAPDRFDGHAAWRQLLRDEHGESLHAFLVAIVEAREHRILVVQIVVDDGDLRRIESELLRVRLHAFDAEIDRGGRTVESDRRRSLLSALRGPFVVNGSAVGVKLESSRNVHHAVSGFNFRSSVSDPVAAARANFEFFGAHLLPACEYAKSAFVRGENRC